MQESADHWNRRAPYHIKNECRREEFEIPLEGERKNGTEDDGKPGGKEDDRKAEKKPGENAFDHWTSVMTKTNRASKRFSGERSITFRYALFGSAETSSTIPRILLPGEAKTLSPIATGTA